MKRPMAYISAAWGNNEFENTETAAKYCRQLYEAGYTPMCPLLFLPIYLNDEIAEEHKDGIDMVRDMLKNDIATAERFRITATTLEGILTIKKQGREKSNG